MMSPQTPLMSAVSSCEDVTDVPVMSEENNLGDVLQVQCRQSVNSQLEHLFKHLLNNSRCDLSRKLDLG